MGERGDQLRPLPHVPRLLRPNGVTKPPREGKRSMWAAEDPCSDRGEGVAGPGLQQRPVARVRWQDLLATWPAFPPTRNGAFSKTARTSKAGPSG